jgi:protocatechuate 3,4-dioxygenase beta subunit
MPEKDLFDLGLQSDLAMLSQSPLSRRKVLKLGLLGISSFLASCVSATATQSSASTTSADGSTCVAAIPGETAGPYPADGSSASNQSLNALALSGIVRKDIRSSLGTGHVAEGVPLTIQLSLVNTNADCAPLAGYAVYLWHSDRDGQYSMYSNGVTDEDYLRGVQESDANGLVTFTSIFPACYSGRWPHVHFEIYPSLALATGSSNIVHTSQLALPEDVCDTVYATTGYSASVQNLSQVTLESDNIFSDGYGSQMATLTGDAASGYSATLTVGIAA